MSKVRVEDVKSMEAQVTVEGTEEVTTPKKEEKLIERKVSKSCNGGQELITYVGDNKSSKVTKTYTGPSHLTPRVKTIDVSKIKEPMGEGREKTYVTFANGVKYLEYLIAERGYIKA